MAGGKHAARSKSFEDLEFYRKERSRRKEEIEEKELDDKLEVQANEILTLMETNKEVEYDEAVQKVQAKHGQKESGGPVPGSNRRRQ